MKLLTKEQSAAWCAANGYPAEVSTWQASKRLEFDFDKASQIPLARATVDSLLAHGELLLLITQWSEKTVFDHLPLYQRFCEAVAEYKPIAECPALVFGPDERNDAISALFLVLHYSWSCVVASQQTPALFSFCYEEYSNMSTENDALFATAKDRLSEWLIY